MSMAAPSWLRVAVVQFAPKLGEVHTNIAKARRLCRGLTPRSVDLVCFPEMIFSGYMFPDASSIAPYLEHPRTGPTSMFCAELARHLQCYVVAGFPEQLEPEPPEQPDTSTTSSIASSSGPSPVSFSPLAGANTALLYDPAGCLVHTYHKSNLFPVDATWARAGNGFTMLDLPLPLGRTVMAICNDLNTHQDGEWTSLEEGPYELAEYCRTEGARLLVLLNAWLKPEEDDDRDVHLDQSQITDSDGTNGTGGTEADEEDTGEDETEPDWRVLNYWAMRLRPLWVDRKVVTVSSGTTGPSTWGREDVGPEMSAGTTRARMVERKDLDDVTVVVCNRFGRERGKTFVGSSAMFSMRRGLGKPRLLHAMGEREEGVCVWSARIQAHTLG